MGSKVNKYELITNTSKVLTKWGPKV